MEEKQSTNERKTAQPMESWKGCQTGDVPALKFKIVQNRSPCTFTLSPLPFLPCEWTSCFHRARARGSEGVVVGCLYGKRLWPAWQLCLMDGPPPSGCSACNKYPCSCLTSLTYQTHLSLLGHPRGTHNYALHSPLAGVSGIAALFMGHSPRAKSQKNR